MSALKVRLMNSENTEGVIIETLGIISAELEKVGDNVILVNI
jgi:hypothetical protein